MYFAFVQVAIPLTVTSVVDPELVSFAVTDLSMTEKGLTAPVHAWRTPPAWSATVEMGQQVSVREFKKFV